jgi:hypothetical protein
MRSVLARVRLPWAPALDAADQADVESERLKRQTQRQPVVTSMATAIVARP